MVCPICGSEAYSIVVKEDIEKYVKEFSCCKCGRLIEKQVWFKNVF